MRHPGAVEAVRRLAGLVVAHLGQGDGVHLGIAPARDERGHPAHGVRAPAVAGLHQQLGVGAHERCCHGDRIALGQHELAPPGAELLDDAEQVVPPARVQPGAVVAQLVEDLVHLEGGRDRLDQHGCPDGPAREAEGSLGDAEYVVPEPRLQVALHLRQVEVGALAPVELALRAVEEVQREVMLLVEVPAPGADHDRGQLVVGAQPVGLPLVAGEVDGPVQDVAQVELAGDHVFPERGVRVLEVGQPDVRAGVERVDGHLPLGGPGDLHPAVHQARRGRGHPPEGVVPDMPGLGQEVERATGGQVPLAGRAGGQQICPLAAELPLEQADQVQRVGGEDLIEPVPGRAHDLDALACHHLAPLLWPGMWN